MKAGTRRDIENFLFPPPLQNLHEKLAFAFRPRIPVDQCVPFLNKTLNVFFLIMFGVADRERLCPVILVQNSRYAGFFSRH